MQIIDQHICIVIAHMIAYRKLTSPAPVLDLKPFEVGLGHVWLDVHLHRKAEHYAVKSSTYSSMQLPLHSDPGK
jgi:hypothetical protein